MKSIMEILDGVAEVSGLEPVVYFAPQAQTYLSGDGTPLNVPAGAVVQLREVVPLSVYERAVCTPATYWDRTSDTLVLKDERDRYYFEYTSDQQKDRMCKLTCLITGRISDRYVRVAEEYPQHDAVRKPKHYQLMEGVEAIEIIAAAMTLEQWKGFCLGNILKYRMRAGKKDDLKQEIGKADYYGELFEKHQHLCRKED